VITIFFRLIYKPLIFTYDYLNVFIVLVKLMDLSFSVHHVKCSIIYFLLLSGLFLIFWLSFGHLFTSLLTIFVNVKYLVYHTRFLLKEQVCK